MGQSKSLKAAYKAIDTEKLYSVEEAVTLMKKLNTMKFDATAEVHFNLGIDPRHADQQIRSTVSLPHGTGKKVNVVVFCEDSDVEAAKAAGATEAGLEDLIGKVAKGWTDFDAAVATPTVMRKLAKVARVLGPKGLMPSPKAGTVTQDVTKTVTALVAGRIEFRNDKTGIVHTVFGKMSFDDKKLVENLNSMIKTLKDIKPSGQKGIYFKSVTVHSTMGAGIKLDMA